MKLIAVDQRVIENASYPETRDALDQRWAEFLAQCDLLPVPIPNHAQTAVHLLAELPIAGVLLTGGSEHPRREVTDHALLHAAEAHGLPLLGVCHGMQVIQRRCGIALEKVSGHVAAEQQILIQGNPASVNSYHDYGTTQSPPDLAAWAKADDGVIKAVRHASKPWLGIMWHPERITPFAARDIALFREHFQ